MDSPPLRALLSLLLIQDEMRSCPSLGATMAPPLGIVDAVYLRSDRISRVDVGSALAKPLP
jgi:hypothetical protein